MKPLASLNGFFKLAGCFALLLCAATNARAQLRIVGALSGTVQDKAGRSSQMRA